MRELIGEFRLRNTRRVYKSVEGYEVTQTDKNGTDYTVRVKDDLVDSLHTTLSGKTVTRAETAEVLCSLPEEKHYNYGYKLEFYVQDVLLVLVALDLADYEKVGRGYQYTVY